MRPRLRLYTGPAEAGTLPEPTVTVRLGDITRILREAARSDRTWLRDFEDDEVQVSGDLYEVISAYVHLRPSA